MRRLCGRVMVGALIGALAPMAAAGAEVGTSPAEPATTVVPFEQANKTIYVRVVVSGRPLWFVLDTGDKYTIIDLAIAKALNLPLGAPVPVGGGGATQIMGALMQGGKAVLPQAPGVDLPLFIGVPLGDLADASGHEFAGILGFDFINQFVVEIDYQAHRLVLHDPAGCRYDGPGESLPITFNAAGHPQVQAQVIDGEGPPVEGRFVLDIGSGATLILDRPLVDRLHMLSDRPTLPWLTGRGFGGGIDGRVGRVAQLRLGGFTIVDPITIFSQAESGPFASTEEQGNIGGGILERFKLILDYSHGRIILEPTAALGRPYDYDKTGLMLVSTGEDRRSFRVDGVADASPAAEAHIRAGDLLVLVDGAPTADFTLSDLRTMLQQEGPFELTFDRSGVRYSVVLRPRRRI